MKRLWALVDWSHEGQKKSTSSSLRFQLIRWLSAWRGILILKMRGKLLQSSPTLCNAMDHSPPGSSVHGILQTRLLKWFAMPSSRRSSWPRNQTHVPYVTCIGRRVLYHCSLPGSSVHGILQARIPEWVVTSFSRDLPDPGIKPGSPTLQADSLPFDPLGKPSGC